MRFYLLRGRRSERERERETERERERELTLSELENNHPALIMQ